MNQMKEATKRSIFRWTHIIFGIPIVGYIYSPFEEIPNYAPAVRFVFLPAIVLSGLWMWKAMSFGAWFQKSERAEELFKGVIVCEYLL